MKKISALLIICFLTILITNANDGTFYMSGNQLIPITETDIEVKKEILKIRKISPGLIEVDVYYEFYNPVGQKSLIVGFEAMPPEGDVDVNVVHEKHPFMKNFTVEMNKRYLQHEVAIVPKKNYFQNNKFNSYSEEDIIQKMLEGNYLSDYLYVYYFNATFEPGLDIIRHTYTFNISGSVDLGLYFNYVLTAANRWANGQIDDFTLIIDMGEFETYHINSTFFSKPAEWKIDGKGKYSQVSSDENYMFDLPAVKFHIINGKITFSKMNFRPDGELFLYTGFFYGYSDEPFSYKTDYLPLAIRNQTALSEPADEMSKKVLRNLPFARRGFVFKTTEIQKYYETMVDWYIPDTNYTGTLESLTQEEKDWIERFK